MENRFIFLYHIQTELRGRIRRSVSREWKDRYKRRRRAGGKTAAQAKAVKWSEIKVAKRAGRVPGKAAMALYVPVP